jgi:beta-lactamase regulating signal transducer with metallopeptidase domain
MCRIEFLVAIEKPFIQTLKRTYGEKWIEFYRLMEANDITALFDYPDVGKEPLKNQVKVITRYKPKSPDAKHFIQGLLND